MGAVVQNKPGCGCSMCKVAGNVLAIDRPAGSIQRGLSPWCLACQHFILAGSAAKSEWE